ncbi:MAG: hypothetical protein H6656_12720 [Ardenticatenaceae bacterium]|nr:hypothetical protein [Ardenticatenaceae bacterium]
MRILTGYMPPTSGDAYIAGYHTVNESLQARQRLELSARNRAALPGDDRGRLPALHGKVRGWMMCGACR